MQSMKLTEELYKSFKVAKVFRENTDRINCLDFSVNGESMIASSNDDSIVVYCCLEGKPKRTVYSKKYGCDLVQYTHAPNTVIYTSNKIDDTIRYLSLHDNKYLRYFPGHTKKVVSLKISPINDMFLSGSQDNTIRLWDLRSPNCQGLMHLNGPPVAAFDPEGLIFAAGIDSRQLKLYDLRSFDKHQVLIIMQLVPAVYLLPNWRGMKIFLLSLKVLLSIILVGVSYYYKATPTEDNEADQENISPTSPVKTKLEEFESGGKELRKRTKSIKTKSLSEIERYTLCSNRIV